MNRRANGTGGKPWWNANKQRFEIKVSLPDGTRRTVFGTTQRDVEKKREKLLGDIETGRPLTSEQLKVGTFLLDTWLPSVDINVAKRGTYRSYKLHVGTHLVPYIGKESLKLLSRGRLMQYRDQQLAKGRSPRSVKMSLDVLRIALNFAVDMELIDRNPAARLKVKVPDNSRYGKALPFAQAHALLRAARLQRNGPLFAFLVTTATRLGEALALKWADVDIPGARFNVLFTLQPSTKDEPWDLVLPKGGRARYKVPLVPHALQALEEQKQRQQAEREAAGEVWHEQGFVFSNAIGEPLSERGIQDAYKLALRNAGLDPSYRIHDLRHTANTYLYKTGTPPPVIMQIVGHTTMAMTARYAHVDDEMLDEARDKLAALWAQDA